MARLDKLRLVTKPMLGGTALKFLVSVSAGFFGGLFSAIGIYVIRQKRRADRLRQAICTEIKRSTPVGAFAVAIMGAESLQTPIIEANLDKLYLLNSDEIAMVTRYHTQMAKVRAYNRRESEDGRVSISKQLAENTSEIAGNTTELLESNIWKRPKPIAKLRGEITRLRGESESKGGSITDEEKDQKLEKLREKVDRMEASGKLRRMRLEDMDVKDMLDDRYEE
ncbi:hypothetical protein GRX03_03420 [Halovenus sp. WSH3]|uniref:Transmembrane protein n=1 Tax=Halovenus carboxidivorans TaxID=2692199 RepID=A0A6B0TBS9_9EURY|nr:hypothetical protein [Halovenus carboxidivorans]MXR50659.1 hypothetical protein [Halovenus carboxidivorans]